MRLNGVYFLLLALGVFWCQAALAQVNLSKFHIEGFSQGTTYQLTYYAADSLITQKQTDSLLASLDRSVSLYLPSSLICKFNRSAKGITIDKHFKILVKKAMEINRNTMGLVDITVKPLVDAWGFGVKKPKAFPNANTVNRLLKIVGSDKIWLTGSFLHKKAPGVQIDLNGIAQGYAADLLAELCEKHKVYNYIAEIGGELRVKGKKPDGEPFRIGIEAIDDNDIDPAPLRKIIEPGDGAVTTSGNYRKHLKAGNKEISHIIDPKTGYPTQNEMISVTVYAKDGITADGYDNGFIAMGLKKTLEFLSERHELGAYIIYKKPNGAVADTVTTGFKSFIKQ
ncbi:FAD:protein FMN transferase [Mucilaginibacter boryungensis]|uniref:FAD:protein FMN transferase n=1 Tax=Mucilaginibacter boryungensis TaxID=768480 RepID=A0ABR9XGR1_9SPHI|nr:FAD:protein FMN transferase [Mucilaginibacter boryungensis]MBE9666569.1 FAD:protein FMN transferase [Mucilaginibacter boryungensis]